MTVNVDPAIPHAYVRRDARETSKAAALLAEPRSGTRRAEILRLINLAPDGLTDDEIIVISGFPHQSVGPRRLELEQGGWIYDSGQRRPTRTGADAIVWVPTGKARVAWFKGRRAQAAPNQAVR